MNQGIKVSITNKGDYHYEKYLIQMHKKEVRKFVFRKFAQDYQWKKINRIFFLYDVFVDKTNISLAYTHPVSIFVQHLLNGKLYKLFNHSSSKN
jgi:hypothetical protein